MRIIRAFLAVAWIGAALASATGVLTAQIPPQPPVSPEITRPAPASAEIESLSRRLHRMRPIFRVAQDYTVPPGEAVREVRVFFGDVTIEGRVHHDVFVTMGSVRLGPAAVVDGTVAVMGGSASIDQGAAVGRDLVVIGGTLTAPPPFSPGRDHVVIGTPWLGDALRDVAPWITRGLLLGRLIVPDLGWIWAVVGIFLLVYLTLNAVFDRPVAACADVLAERPLSMFMAGLLVLLLMVPVIALIAASVIGLVLIPFILCALIAAALVGKAGVIRAIGRAVLRPELPEGRIQAGLALAIGFGLLTLAYMVPVLGFVTWALSAVLGFGAATVTLRAMLKRERPSRPAPPPAPETSLAPSAAFARRNRDDDDVSPGAVPAGPAVPTMPLEPPVRPTAYADGLAQHPRATFLDRVAAFVLDCLLVAVASIVLDQVDLHDGYFLLLLVYHIAFWAWRGTTLGGIICNLRVIRTNGTELRPVDATVRGLSSIFSIGALGIGCLWMLQDSEGQMWHDKIAGTLVVKVPRELVLP
jgi:uncharacterized RDD family membrane protein YckC